MTLTDEVKRMIESAFEGAEITSASPTHTNVLKQLNNIELPDLDSIVAQEIESTQSLKQDKKVKNTIEKVQQFDEGAVGKIQDMTTAQIGNITSFAKNPFRFITGAVFKKFTKGAGIAALAVIIFEAVKAIFLELFKPGREFDTQFRERISQQILIFLERKEQRELRQGNKQVITSTIGGLRGNQLQGQIGGNFYNPERIPTNFLDSRRVSSNNFISQDARSMSFTSVGQAGARSRR